MTDGDYLLVAAREAAKGFGHTRPNPVSGFAEGSGEGDAIAFAPHGNLKG